MSRGCRECDADAYEPCSPFCSTRYADDDGRDDDD